MFSRFFSQIAFYLSIASFLGVAFMPMALVEARKMSFAQIMRIQTIKQEDIKREQYYRGVYDICVVTVSQSPDDLEKTRKWCLWEIGKKMKASWYEKPSKGWQWPP